MYRFVWIFILVPIFGSTQPPGFPENPGIRFPTMPTVTGFQPIAPSEMVPAHTLTPTPIIFPEVQDNPFNDPSQGSHIQKILREVSQSDSKLPTLMDRTPPYGAGQLYQLAYNEIVGMLQGMIRVNLSKVVFFVENAYQAGKLSYGQYDRAIKAHCSLVRHHVREKRALETDPYALTMSLVESFRDTLIVGVGSSRVIHSPFGYDFEDFWGQKDFSKQFVTKLLLEGTGQCHSLPLLFKILADELGVPARLAFSPGHSYIRVMDQKGNWVNYETTNGQFVSDAWIMQSGFVKAEGIKNGIYMTPLDHSATLAYCLADLAKGFSIQYGLDEFYLKCLNTALAYHPNNIYALLQKADYYIISFQNGANSIGAPPLKEIQEKHPDLFSLYQEAQKMMKLLVEVGYEPIPKEIYSSWLQSNPK